MNNVFILESVSQVSYHSKEDLLAASNKRGKWLHNWCWKNMRRLQL